MVGSIEEPTSRTKAIRKATAASTRSIHSGQAYAIEEASMENDARMGCFGMGGLGGMIAD